MFSINYVKPKYIMKKIVLLNIVLATLLMLHLQAQTNSDYTVQTRVVVNTSPPSISIRWPKIATGVTAYNIYRKEKTDQSWGNILGSTLGTDTIWTDTQVKIGETYEYNIQKLNGTTLLGISYLLSGIEIPVVHSRGKALIVVEAGLASAIPNELKSFMADINADGWEVLTTQVSKSDSIQKVKREIKRIDLEVGGINALILLGHIPVPYSGNFGKIEHFRFPPDGHVEHSGCWPADVYYAVDYDQWTDTITNIDATRIENKNIPGDGKLDQTRTPAKVNYLMGRIDLSNLPAFPLSEVELTKQYIKKAHDFRFKITKTVEKGVIDDRFAVTQGAYGSQAWRNFAAMFGPQQIIQGDMLQHCDAQNLLFAYGAGGGTYTDCGRVCSTDSFLRHKGAIFNMIFGSNFGDWDNKNNLLRAPLAAKENGLTNAWSGRPHWQNHAMALGEPVGYSAQLTQNNLNTYTYNDAANAIHIALMGDPTLRLHMIAPPSNVTATPISNNTMVTLNWLPSIEPGILGYYIYHSEYQFGTYLPLNINPQLALNFTDSFPNNGNNFYQVKAVKLTTSASGSYFNTSHGASISIGNISGNPVDVDHVIQAYLDIVPNPANSVITMKTNYNINDLTTHIYNQLGQIVISKKPSLNQLNNIDINVSDLKAGLYFLKYGTMIKTFVKL